MKTLILYEKSKRDIESVKSNGQITLFGKSLLAKNVENLRRCGLEEIIYVTPESFDYSEITSDLKIGWIKTPSNLGTGGEMKYASERCEPDRKYLVFINDSLYRFDRSFLSRLQEKPMLLTVREKNPVSFSSVITDESGCVSRFVPKTYAETICSDTVFSGAAYFTDAELKKLYSGTYYDIRDDFIPRLVRDGCLYAATPVGDRVRFSTADDLRQFQVGAARESDLPVSVSRKGKIIRRSVIGVRTCIGDNALIADSVVGKDCRIGNNVRLVGCLLGDGVTVKDNGTVCEGAVVATGTVVGEAVTIRCNCLATSDAHNSLNIRDRNGFRESGISFANGKIVGNPSGDIVHKIGYALARVFGGTSVVGYALDCHPKALAVTAGILSGGTDVLDVGQTDEWIVRYTVRTYGLNFGVFVSGDEIVVCEGDGLDLYAENRYAAEELFKDGYESCTVGKYRLLGGTERMYKRKLRHYLFDMPALKVKVSAPSFLSDSVVSLPRQDGETLCVRNKLYAPDFTDSFTDCAVLYAYGKTYGRVYIPQNYVYCAEDIGKKYGFYVERVSDESTDRRFLYDMSDPYVRASVLLRYLAKNDISLRALKRMMPEICETERQYNFAQGTNNAVTVWMTSLASEPSENGRVRLIPSKDLSGLRICVQSHTAEAAEELCADVVKRIQNVERKELDKKKKK